MRSDSNLSFLRMTALLLTILFAAGAASAGTINLVAQRTSMTLPDGATVPMWGLCTNDASAKTGGVTISGGACSTMKSTGGWAPGPTIIVKPGDDLTINLQNTLPTPTSIVIIGQLGGGLGSPNKDPSPAHDMAQPITWPVAGAGLPPGSATFTPPLQGPRARSFSPEAAANSGTQTYTWKNLKPGTYLYETGTHPSLQAPMGLYGVLVVTIPPVTGITTLMPGVVSKQAFPGVVTHGPTMPVTPQNSFFGGIVHPLRGSAGVQNVVAAPNTIPTLLAPGIAYNNVQYDEDVVLLFSEVDPVQNAAVDKAAAAGTSEYITWLSDPASPCNTTVACYPPAVNYNPKYFLINGHAFDETAPVNSAFPPGPYATVSTGNVLMRVVNAGLKTHIPSLVGRQMSLVAEDGNLAPGNPKIQNEALLTAGKTYDALVSPEQGRGLGENGASPGRYAPAAYAVFDRELSLSNNNRPNGGMHGFVRVAGGAMPSVVTPIANNDTYAVPPNSTIFAANVLSNDTAISNPKIGTAPAHGTVMLNADGTFTYTPAGPSIVNDTFTYYGNGNTSLSATVTLSVSAAMTGAAPVANADAYTSNLAYTLGLTTTHINGVLGNDTDPSGYPLTATIVPGSISAGLTVVLNPDGSFTATPAAPGVYTFAYNAVNSQATMSAAPAAVTLTFGAPSNINVSVVDSVDKVTAITDYSWTIEEDRTFHTPDQLTPTGGTAAAPVIPNVLGTNFHTSHMPLIATGCTGPISCNDNQTINGVAVTPKARTTPDQVVLDPAKYYFISVLPGDAASANPAIPNTGHSMGGASITPANITAAAAPAPTPATLLAATIPVLAPPSPLTPAQISVFVFEDNAPTNGDIDALEQTQGLGGFAVILWDSAGQNGDPAGQMTYDVYNMPLTNALFKLDPVHCPGLPNATTTATSIGVVYTCPEKDINGNPSPLAGHALIQNVNPGRYDVITHPGAARIGNGETWLQVSTLEGTPANDAFAKIAEPAYFQEFGPPGFHAFVGYVNPDHIKQTQAAVCTPTATNTTPCPNTINGKITNLHMTRPSQTALYDSNSHDYLAPSTCYVGLNSQNGIGPNIAFATCDPDGNFSFAGVPDGSYQVVVWDQWLDQIIEYRAVTVPNATTVAGVTNMGDIPVFSWFTNIELHSFLDLNGNGVQDPGESGISQIPMTIRYRDGGISNISLTDSTGDGSINELFPLFNWYVAESDTTRYTGTQVNTVVDGGGPVDTTGPYAGILSTKYPTGDSTIKNFPGSTLTLGVLGFISQTNIINWGKRPYNIGENGGITGMVVYTSTRGFDDPRWEIQFNWEPAVPRVKVRLYQETQTPNGTTGLVFIDETTSSSWDDFANGSHADPVSGLTMANMQCPGQLTTDPFFTYTLGAANQYKCYDSFHNWNQTQPAVYDGRYRFPSMAYQAAHGNLLPGKYVVEVLPPDGYEIVKEEDKNILIGDVWVASVTQQFAGLSNVFILPDRATINAAALPGPNISLPACVGDMHRVPDFLSLFPGSGQVAPFAGADRPLCNRKEVVLNDQMQANADFHLFTQSPVSSHYTGMILDDAASEFNAAAPDFGEKFAVPFVPVSIKDFNGVEISRTYADQWGMFNGLTPSTWEVNPPNPSGYAPNMLTTCMNDPGPIRDSVTGLTITDPLYNPMYSIFCYTNPFMPGRTTYLDTPVLPVAAFAAGYYPVDCAYPDGTPGILQVNGTGVGPWINDVDGGTLTIMSLGNVAVPNHAYAGPDLSLGNAPKTIIRDYGFGATAGTVSIRRFNSNTLVPLTVTSWTNAQIVVSGVPNNLGPNGGELIVTRGDNGRSTVNSVTVTNSPDTVIRVSAGQSIQSAIDAANPGDLILVDPGAYNEMLIMWKPVRLQGAGAGSTIINAAKYPDHKLAAWRPRINQLFGLDAAGNQTLPALVDPLPAQPITGGIVLLEPTVLSSEEGAGVTVLAKNLDASQCTTPIPPTLIGGISNFNCAPSRIDGFSITGGDTGGGIYVNGWAHNLQIANNSVHGNAGTFTGGIRIGQPNLSPELAAGATTLGYDVNVNIHHNYISLNGTVEPNNGEGSGGGLSMCSGTDNYKVNYNFICGNISLGDGGGVGHVGFSPGGDISHNWIIFNQSLSQSSTVSGGGIVIQGEISDDLTEPGLGSGGLTVDSNLIQGNNAAGGHGGGLHLQDLRGDAVTLSNNTIVDNVAGFSGGGISLANAPTASIINNTVANNDSTATVGAVFITSPTTSTPQPAGISSDAASISATLNNNIIWQNRSFYFTADATSQTGYALAPTLTPPAIAGTCATGANYWDLGVIGQSQANPTLKLNPTNSVLTSTTGYDGSNSATPPVIANSYCNGARYMAAGRPESPILPTPFGMVSVGAENELQAAGAEDEGGNWVDVRYGPLWLNSVLVFIP